LVRHVGSDVVENINTLVTSDVWGGEE